jgi:hypothetical protein
MYSQIPAWSKNVIKSADMYTVFIAAFIQISRANFHSPKRTEIVIGLFVSQLNGIISVDKWIILAVIYLLMKVKIGTDFERLVELI